MKIRLALLAGLLLLMSAPIVCAQYPAWPHDASLFILTTPDGADLPAAASVHNFPVLVRLTKDSFDFKQAAAAGADIRFSSAGKPLAYQIEDWDAARGAADIWVKIPLIKGNASQEIKLHWGNADAVSESNGAAVFNADNGYLSVWHMNEPVKDEVGTLSSKDVGTTSTPGMIGPSRHLAGKQGIFGGETIPNYPAGGNSHSTEMWFRAEQSNATLIGWGNEGGGRGSKVRMQLRGPSHIHIDSDFSDVNGAARVPLHEWIHVAHTYGDGEGRIYINGKLDASANPKLNVKSPARLWLGGWYNDYDFQGDLDEVRVSNVARSADWIKLEYENQKPMQTLVGSLVQPGKDFSVSQNQLTLQEGKSATITARAGGARKLYWTLAQDGVETVVGVDRLTYTLNAGRVTGDKQITLRFRAVYANETRTQDIPVTIHEAIPDPVFSLQAPAAWNGRDTIEVRPMVTNLDAMRSSGAGDVKTTWNVLGGAVIKEIAPDRLILKRSQYTGPITVQASMQNGGAEVVASASIPVTEPKQDAWVQRVPDTNEKPVDGQFFARDDSGQGTLYYTGKLDGPAEAVAVTVYANDKQIYTQSQAPTSDHHYAFAVKLKAGLVHYRVELSENNGTTGRVIHRADNLLCGDAYIINGQSNAVADVKDNPETSEWIRSFGNMSGGSGSGWAPAVRGSVSGDLGRIGYWGFDLAKELVVRYQIPICIINGAVGGTRVDQHMPNPDNHSDPQTIYGRLYARILAAHLTHGIRGLLWYQGENNQGAASPTGDEDWKSYQQYFVDLAAAWKQDYPNLRYYYVYQFWPDACSMGHTHAGDMTGEVIRTLPTLFSNMRIMSVIGVVAPHVGRGNCHFPWQGYAQIASLMAPAIERDNYGLITTEAVTAPNLRAAYFTTPAKNEVVLEFDQPMVWNDAAKNLLYLYDAPAMIRSGKATGNQIILELSSASSAKLITYLKGKEWDGTPGNLLYGANKVAALTFCDVSISEFAPVAR